MGKFEPKDITGQRYGMLTAICRTEEKRGGGYKWLCKCDCGNEVVVDIGNLRKNGGTQSCGCVKKNREIIPLQEYENRKKEELETHTGEWEYVRCYNRDKGKHIVRCRKCGAEKQVHSFLHIAVCQSCDREQKKYEEEQRKYKSCVVCGARFKPQKSTALYCSDRCSRKAQRARRKEQEKERNKTYKRLREARAVKNGKVDYSITLARLIERDNHICQLCGREVNESDYIYVGDVFIAGNDYPSIDHIKPLSKGGVHQWENVQLAHRLCNSLKSNKEN